MKSIKIGCVMFIWTILVPGFLMPVQGQDYFPLGLWYVFHEVPYPGSISQNERTNFNNINATWLIGVGYEWEHIEADYMSFCDDTGGKIRMPILGEQGTQFWPNLWHVLSPNADDYPDSTWCAQVDTFIVRVRRNYADNIGFENYGVGHELYDESLWAGLGHICNRIEYYDSEHKSLMTGGLNAYSDPYAFADSVSSLSVFEHEQYVFLETVPHTGNDFQDALNNLLANYDLCMHVFRDRNTEWHAIIQSHSSYYEGHNYLRWPTASEIRVQAYLALCRGATGIKYFTYWSGNSGPYIFNGMVTEGANRVERHYPIYGGDYVPFDSVRVLNGDLSIIGTEMLNFYPQDAFNSENIPTNSYIEDIEDDQIIGDTGTIEIGIFQDSSNPDDDYFMLVNRLCSSDEQGNPADPQTVTVRLESSNNRRLIEDVLASRKPWDGNANRVAYRVLEASEREFTVTLNPGEGRLFRVTDGLEGTLSGNRYWSGEVLIAGDITVNPSDTLTVHKGTSIYFEGNHSLWVQGSLTATGDPGHRIKFTSIQGDYSPGSWNYIRIVNTSKNSNLTYCNIYSASTGLVMENVTGTITIDECRVKNNSIGLLAQNSSGSISIQNSNIEYNQTGVWLNNVKPSIKYTDIKHNSGKGLYLYNQSNVGFGYDKIYDNSEGIYADYNTTPSIYSSAGHNWIYDNSGDGVSGRSNSYPKLGFDILVKYGYNHIYSNGGYEVANYNSGGSYIMAERNYWSASETNPVPPQDTYGLVDWDPVLPPGPPAKSNNNNPALIAEVNEDYQQAADEYLKQIEQSPKSADAGFAVSGLVRCYEKTAKSEIVGVLDDLIAKYAGTATEISAKELSLPFLLQEGSLEKGLERSKELLQLSQGTDR